MRSSRPTLPLILSLLFLAWHPVCAQTADDFFNTGAQFYISNNIANAKQAVEGGLKLYPDNVRLKKLEELLKQQQQQQQNQNQQQQNQQNQQNQQSQQDKQNQQQSQQNQQNQQPNQKPQDQQNQQNQRQNQSPQDQQSQKQAQEAAAREMSPEEAKRLLDAQKGDEQLLQLKPKTPPENQNRPVKDW